MRKIHLYRLSLVVLFFGMALIGLSRVSFSTASAAKPAKQKWLMSKAYVVPKRTAPDGEGYFAIIEGHNRRLYIGTHANAINSWLVEFDPAAEKMKAVVDVHKVIGKDLRGFGSQAKIHTRNNVGKSGKIYFGSKQGYPNKTEKREDYPGGYPMVYDPATGKTKVYPIPVPHHGINSITPDEAHGVAYISTCSDHRPGPGESAIFLQLDLKTGKYKRLMDTEHFYGFIVVDHLGRAYHPILGGDIARFDPRSEKLQRLKQTIDGKSPTAETSLAKTPKPDPINWDISPDRKTIYAQAMRENALYAYDLTQEGNVLKGRKLGTLLPGAEGIDCRAMCVGPSGTAWCAITKKHTDGTRRLHLVGYKPGDKAPRDYGQVGVSNPDYTETKDKNGKTLPFHGGFYKTPEGITTSKYVILGVCEAKDGSVYILALIPYTVLRVPAQQLK